MRRILRNLVWTSVIAAVFSASAVVAAVAGTRDAVVVSLGILATTAAILSLREPDRS